MSTTTLPPPGKAAKAFRGALLCNLEAIRTGQGISRQQLADRSDLAFTTIWRLERGLVGASYVAHRRIAAALRVPPSALTAD